MSEVHVFNEGGKFTQVIEVDGHRLFADQPQSAGGDNKGLQPHDFLLAALGSCTAMTVKMYSDRKNWPLKKVDVVCSLSKEDQIHIFKRKIKFIGELSIDQKTRLKEIADRCPVHLTLTGTIRVDTTIEN